MTDAVPYKVEKIDTSQYKAYTDIEISEFREIIKVFAVDTPQLSLREFDLVTFYMEDIKQISKCASYNEYRASHPSGGVLDEHVYNEAYNCFHGPLMKVPLYVHSQCYLIRAMVRWRLNMGR